LIVQLYRSAALSFANPLYDTYSGSSNIIMRFSAVTAFCAAPLALAGTLQQDLVARGAMGVEVGPPQGGPSKQNNQKSNSNDNNNQKSNNNNNYNGGGNGNTVLIQQSQINEIVVIWVNNGGGAATSTVTDTVTVTAAGGAQGTAGAAAAVATHQVTVGGAAGLVYSPESVVAAVGDMVVFTFMASNHTVTQSAFAEPCKKLPTGMDSGFMANINNTVSPPPQMAMQVTVATPIWFYCRQSGHCGKGNDLLHQPHRKQDPSRVQANGHCAKWHWHFVTNYRRNSIRRRSSSTSRHSTCCCRTTATSWH